MFRKIIPHDLPHFCSVFYVTIVTLLIRPSAGEIDTFSASVPTDQEVQNDPTSNAQQIQVGEIPIPVQRSEV